MAIGQSVKTSVVRVGNIAAGTADERPIFVAPHKTKIHKIKVVNASDITAGSTDYITVDFQDKGSDGSGTDSVAKFDTDSNNDNVSLTAFDPHVLKPEYDLAKDNSLTIKKSNTGAGKAFDQLAVIIVYEAAAGLNWNDY